MGLWVFCACCEWRYVLGVVFFFSSRRRHTRCLSDWSSDVCSSDLVLVEECEGGLFLQPAVEMPMRDIPKAIIDRWIARDEADMATFRATPRKHTRGGFSFIPAVSLLHREKPPRL